MDNALPFSPAPDLQVAEWINSEGPITLPDIPQLECPFFHISAILGSDQPFFG